MGAMTTDAAPLLLSAADAALAAAEATPAPGAPAAIDTGALRDRLAMSTRPMLLLGDGPGWSDGACADIALFAGANALTTAVTAGGSDRLDNENPCYAGTLGPAADPRLTARLELSDCLVAVGEVPAPWADHPALLPLPGDAAAVAAALVAGEPVAEVPWTGWAIAARNDYADWSAADPWPGPVDVGAILGWLRERLPTDALVAADGGPLAGLVQRHLLFRRPGRLVTGTEGMAGFAAAAAVAARTARPRRMAAGFTDGAGLLAALPLLAQAAAARAPALVVALNEGPVDLAAAANAQGAFAVTVATSPDFIQAFWDALWSRTAALIELRVESGQITTQTLWDAARATAMTQAEG
ncbi:thiamine pyrophosphate-dependent acetolactate synthase large subunit-like protein [Azospirillum fermentarium]|uniref:hypothetical protein n=1 Tax=Azospirillum fermentarium TaxID=1233114 RepID=UPI002225C660|nr:hypothetical protein [Azospirillum fermentarium]MCW2244501.1 thiamine pyrophosphate-dependent acetolactate synthase large subunit-like protein [Azospirillum fermentarium]